MADNNKVELHVVDRCDLGRLGSDRIALKITTAVAKNGEILRQNAVFALSEELARGLAKSLVAILEDATKPPPVRVKPD